MVTSTAHTRSRVGSIRSASGIGLPSQRVGRQRPAGDRVLGGRPAELARPIAGPAGPVAARERIGDADELVAVLDDPQVAGAVVAPAPTAGPVLDHPQPAPAGLV